MKRESYSIHRVKSARYGDYQTLRAHLHVLLLVHAETTAGMADYDLYTPQFSYEANGRNRVSDFPVAIKFTDKRIALWATTSEQRPDKNAPLERARQAQASELGANYRLFTEANFYANPIEHRNRLALQAYMAAWHHVQTEDLEMAMLQNLNPGQPATLPALYAKVIASPPLARLAAYRLVARGLVASDLATAPLESSFRVWRG